MAHKKVKDMKPKQRSAVMANMRGRQANDSKGRREKLNEAKSRADARRSGSLQRP